VEYRCGIVGLAYQCDSNSHFATDFLLYYANTRNLRIISSDAALDLMKNDPMVMLLSLIAILPAHIITLLVSWAVATEIGKYPFKETLGLRLGRIKLSHILLVVIFLTFLQLLCCICFRNQRMNL